MDKINIVNMLKNIIDPVTNISISNSFVDFLVKDRLITIILEYDSNNIIKAQQSSSQLRETECECAKVLIKHGFDYEVRLIITNKEQSKSLNKIVHSKVETINTSVNGPAEEQEVKSNKRIRGIRNVIMVASGKGGVGKSTVAANLAVSMAQLGYKTAILDADIYGPSIPHIFELEFGEPEVSDGKMMPIVRHDVSIMSMGLILDQSQAALWRGPMATKALHQLMMETKWGDIDYLIIDSPPGTNDVHLTLCQHYEIDAAIVVTTPQDLSLIDARKGIDMFRTLKIDVMGVVENMSYIQDQETGKRIYPYGMHGGETLAKEFGIEVISEIPMLPTQKRILVHADPVIQTLFEKMALRVKNYVKHHK